MAGACPDRASISLSTRRAAGRRVRQGVDAALDLGVVDQRRGVVRLDPGVDHQRAGQPQCFLSMKAPMPSMSAAGLERVNVTQRKLSHAPGGEFAVVDDHDQAGSRGSDRRRSNERQNDGDVVRRRRGRAGPWTARTPGRTSARVVEAVGQPQAGGQLGRAARAAAGRRRRSPPSSPGSARGPSSRACRSWSGSGSAGRSSSRRARAGGAGSAAMSWMSSVGVVLAGDDQQVLGQRQLPLAEDGVGDGQQLLRPPHRRRTGT